jgi:hypothetical protein
MYERHENEQYFWDEATIQTLADYAQQFPQPCRLCAPLLGVELAKRGVRTRILDVDERFAQTPGFQLYDVFRPQWLGEEFGLIVCDPPFWKVSLSQLFAAIRLLARHDYAQPILICYPSRRAANLMGTFARFNLQPTGYFPQYVTVQKVERNEIEFFSNLPQSTL